MGLRQVVRRVVPAGVRGRVYRWIAPPPEDIERLRHELAGQASIVERSRPFLPRTCNICGYQGDFADAGRPVRVDALCPRCGSFERHRLFWLWYARTGRPLPAPVLHFAPEPVLRERLSAELPGQYRSADLFEEEADLKLDIEAIELPDASVGTVIANHVLEHVDDRKAFAELRRVLVPGGLLICAVPIIEGWPTTYEDPSITAPEEREIHFGQSDHVRYYGRDFRDRPLEAGFELVEEVVGSPQACIEFGLLRGEVFFVFRRPPVD